MGMTKQGIKCIGGPLRGEFIELRQGIYTIGREESNSIFLDSQAVSRQHAEIRVSADQTTIRDLKSANGTLVNNKRVTEQQVLVGDKIYIGDFIFEYVANQPSIGTNETNAAINASSTPYSHQESKKTPGLLPAVDWRLKILGLLIIVILVDHLFVAQLFVDKIKTDITNTSIKRARDVARYLAEKNRQDLFEGNEDLLDTDTVIGEDGVVAAFIANQSGRILSPTHKLNQQLSDPISQQALQLENNEVLSRKIAGNMYQFATPIRVYDDTKGTYRTLGVATILYSPKNVQGTLDATRKIWLISISFVPLVVFVLFFIIRVFTLPPLAYLSEKISELFRGDIERIDRRHSIQPIIPLIDAANAAAVRLKETESPADASYMQAIDNNSFFREHASDSSYIEWLITITSDAMVVLSQAGTILALNQKAAGLLEVESSQTSGLHFEEIITNRYFSQFIGDCLADLERQPQQVISRTLEYGDFAYQLTCATWPNSPDTYQQAVIVIEKI